MEKTTIEIDVSLLLPHAAFLEPVDYYSNKKRLIRIPYFWEDDLEMQRPVPCWQLTPLLEGRQQGLKVFDFHPVHLYLNAPNMGPYQALKERVSDLSTAAPSDLAPFVQSGEGPRTLFLQILASQRTRRDACRIKDIGERWLLSTRG